MSESREIDPFKLVDDPPPAAGATADGAPVFHPTPRLQLEALVVLDGRGRIVAARDPLGSAGPKFLLVRGAKEVVWAVGADVDDGVARELASVAATEPPSPDWERPLVHVSRYRALLSGPVRSGPAFGFPASIVVPDGLFEVRDEALLDRHFTGWTAGEIAAGAAPMIAVVEDGWPVSVCFCARWSAVAAEAGLDTAAAYRGRGLAGRVVSGWAAAVRRSGRTPLYSTSWENAASLAVARKLGLEIYAADWTIGR